MNNTELLEKYNECQPIIEEMDYAVSVMFTKYCKIFKIHRAYGIEKWEISGNHIDIVQDTSAMSCYNTADHRLPLAYLLDDNAEDLMMTDAVNKTKAETERALWMAQINLENGEKDLKRAKEALSRQNKR